MIGVRTNTVLQQMLQEVDFKDQGLCCIVDRDGTMVVSACLLYTSDAADEL